MRDRVRLTAAMHTGFFLLLAASAARLLVRHGWRTEVTPLLLCAGLAVVYAAGVVLGSRWGRGVVGWLVTVIALWVVLVLLAPSFAWCAVPLYFLCLRHLRLPAVVAAAVVLTGAVIIGQLRIAEVVDPSLVLAPIGIAAMTTVVFGTLERELTQRQGLIDDLVATRGTLAETQRRAGVLAERQRLAREIHDSLAQGFTSAGLLIQAAERAWDSDPAAARSHVDRAGEVCDRSLTEARRFVADLRPEALDSGSLPAALAELCERWNRDHDIDVRFRTDGAALDVDAARQATLLRVAEQAVGNAVEHGAPSRVTVTLSFLDDEVALDVVDDGTGFAPAPAAGRGFGLRSMRERLARVGGTLEVESRPDEGTAVAARVPLREEENDAAVPRR